MLARVALVFVCGLGVEVLGAGWVAAEDLAPEQASAFVVGKLFSYTCFEGTAGIGRIFPDGSVVGTIRIRGEGEPRFAALPPGTIRVDGPAICAHLSGLPIAPCFRVQKIDNRTFRGSVSGLDFAYCDFYQPNARTHLVSNPAKIPAATPRATPQVEANSALTQTSDINRRALDVREGQPPPNPLHQGGRPGE